MSWLAVRLYKRLRSKRTRFLPSLLTRVARSVRKGPPRYLLGEVGRCGQCTGKYDGDANEVVTHDGNQFLDEDRIEAGWLLTCVAYPRDDFELEVTHPDVE